MRSSLFRHFRLSADPCSFNRTSPSSHRWGRLLRSQMSVKNLSNSSLVTASPASWCRKVSPARSDGEPPHGVRAIAYDRHSAQDRQANSIPIQQDQVREWSAKNGVQIINEFIDAGKSGLDTEGRPVFTEMMEEWVKKRSDFDYFFCLDVSRWGRFQDIDLSAPSTVVTASRSSDENRG